MQPGARNLITDVPGLLVGNAQNLAAKTGVTVVTGREPLTAGVHVMGGAPGTRETDALAPDRLVQLVDALVLSGGSAIGLEACSGVSDALIAAGRGHPVGPVRVPIVPGAIIFDLLNGGDKGWDTPPYRALGRTAFETAADHFDIGSVGAGVGATTAGLRGGLGSASLTLSGGVTVGAVVAVNALGATTDSAGRFHAAAFELDGEFGGLPPADAYDPLADTFLTKASARENTTIAVVATDATLTQAQCQRMAVAAHDGMARALIPSHTPFDGDLVFAVSSGQHSDASPAEELMLGHAAAVCLSRAIARGIFEAQALDGDLLPNWQGRFGG